MSDNFGNSVEKFAPQELELLVEASRGLLPRVPQIASEWTNQLAAGEPLLHEETTFRQVLEINNIVLDGIFRPLSQGNLVAALEFYRRFHRDLIAATLEVPLSQRINLEQYFNSAQVAMQIQERAMEEVFVADPLKLATAKLCVNRFWGHCLQSLASIYSELREAYQESLRAKVETNERLYRELYEETRRTEAALRESEVRFAAFMRNLNGPAFIKDLQGRYLFVNEAVGRLSGVKSELWVGKTAEEIWPVPGARQSDESDGELIRTRQPVQTIEVIASSYWLVSKFPILNSHGDLVMIGGVSMDITESKRHEKEMAKARDAALEASRLKSAFLANMSHEIRTPLNVILGHSSLLAEHLAELGDNSQHSVIDAIGRAGLRLMDTIQAILDISEIEVGTFQIKRVPVQLGATVERLVNEYKPAAVEKGLKISYRNGGAPSQLIFDEYCLIRALSNLIHNAIKFTAKGEIEVTVRRDHSGAPAIDVRDTGVGIEPGYMPMLFQHFSQEQLGYTRPFEGAGLGLALAKRYLELNGATISVESEKWKGTCFTIHFATGSGVESPTDAAIGLRVHSSAVR